MPSLRALTKRVTILRDANAGPGATGTGSARPDFQPIATDVPYTIQPMTDALKRKVPGDIAVTDFFGECPIGTDHRKGDRVQDGDQLYRVEALERWDVGSPTVQHIETGMKRV
jgi:hypothetical protein